MAYPHWLMSFLDLEVLHNKHFIVQNEIEFSIIFVIDLTNLSLQTHLGLLLFIRMRL